MYAATYVMGRPIRLYFSPAFLWSIWISATALAWSQSPMRANMEELTPIHNNNNAIRTRNASRSGLSSTRWYVYLHHRLIAFHSNHPIIVNRAAQHVIDSAKPNKKVSKAIRVRVVLSIFAFVYKNQQPTTWCEGAFSVTHSPWPYILKFCENSCCFVPF